MEESSDELIPKYAFVYRSIVGMGIYLAQERYGGILHQRKLDVPEFGKGKTVQTDKEPVLETYTDSDGLATRPIEDPLQHGCAC